MKPRIGMNMDVAAVDGWPRMAVGAAYVDAVREAGGWPVLVPAVPEEADLRERVEEVEGFVFIGGADYPSFLFSEPPHPKVNLMHERRWNTDILLARLALERRIPVLGICGGCQLLCIACGGKIIQHLPGADAHLKADAQEVEIVGGRILRQLFGLGRITVNSYHHQAVDPAAPGRGLEVAARAADGTVEAIEGTAHWASQEEEDRGLRGSRGCGSRGKAPEKHTASVSCGAADRFLLGLQWHPERMKNEEHRRKIFGAFVEAAGGATG